MIHYPNWEAMAAARCSIPSSGSCIKQRICEQGRLHCWSRLRACHIYCLQGSEANHAQLGTASGAAALPCPWEALGIVVSPLEETGRSKARSSRLLVRQEVNEEMVEEFLVYVVERSKMREMIVETSAEVGSDALTDVRGRSARSTARWMMSSIIS